MHSPRRQAAFSLTYRVMIITVIEWLFRVDEGWGGGGGTAVRMEK
jgi:hypothetical protein